MLPDVRPTIVVITPEGSTERTIDSWATAVAKRDLNARLAVWLRHAPTDSAGVELAGRLVRALPSIQWIVSVRDPAAWKERRVDRGIGVHVGSSAEWLTEIAPLSRDAEWRSASCHDPSAVQVAVARGATRLFVSPVFAVPGKGPARGLAALGEARSVARRKERDVEILALGGVTSENAGACLEAGADGLAVIRAVWSARDPVDALFRLDCAAASVC